MVPFAVYTVKLKLDDREVLTDEKIREMTDALDDISPESLIEDVLRQKLAEHEVLRRVTVEVSE